MLEFVVVLACGLCRFGPWCKLWSKAVAPCDSKHAMHDLLQLEARPLRQHAHHMHGMWPHQK